MITSIEEARIQIASLRRKQADNRFRNDQRKLMQLLGDAMNELDKVMEVTDELISKYDELKKKLDKRHKTK